MINYTEETENKEKNDNKTETDSKTNASKPPEPVTTTEDAGEIIKPGGKKEKNPKKAGRIQ